MTELWSLPAQEGESFDDAQPPGIGCNHNPGTAHWFLLHSSRPQTCRSSWQFSLQESAFAIRLQIHHRHLCKVLLIIICTQVMWIMDKVFKFTNFGVVSWMHDDFFILAGRDHRDTSLVHLKRHLSEVRSFLKWPYTKQTILISGVHPKAEEVFSGVSWRRLLT